MVYLIQIYKYIQNKMTDLEQNMFGQKRKIDIRNMIQTTTKMKVLN